MESITALEVQQEKVNLRIRTRKALATLSPQEVQQSDRKLFRQFLSLPQVSRATTILLFWGITGLEPDTTQLVPTLLDMGKVVCMPRAIQNHGLEARRYRPGDPCQPTAYGVMEPDASCPLVEKQEIDLALVPAMCYDRLGYRLGFGAGYYDRWLADFTGMTVGLCREQILRQELPVEAHDRPVHVVLTEREILIPNGSA